MNELRKEYHNKTAGQIGEKARDLQTSYFTDEYVFWLEDQLKQLRIGGVSNCKRDETLELLEEIMVKVKEADSEVENGIYDPMLECAKDILNNYKIERR